MHFRMSKSYPLALLIFIVCMEKNPLLLFHFPVNDQFTKQQECFLTLDGKICLDNFTLLHVNLVIWDSYFFLAFKNAFVQFP